MKKVLLFLSLVAVTALAACLVDFADLNESNKFVCSSNADCLERFECRAGTCVGAGMESQCIDEDNDGYGVGEEENIAACSACTNSSDCRADCDDADQDVSPGGKEICDGKDNDCNPDTPDGVVECETSSDCPREGGGTLSSCNNGFCEYKPALQLGAECQQPLECVNGEREPIPEQCQG